MRMRQNKVNLRAHPSSNPMKLRKKNRKNLESLSSTVIRLIVESSQGNPSQQGLAKSVLLNKTLLVFLEKIVTHAHLSLNLSQIKKLWGSCTTGAAVQPPAGSSLSLSFIFFSWLSRVMADKLVDTNVQEAIFHDLIAQRACNPGDGKDSIPLFHCFKNMFDQINMREGKLRRKSCDHTRSYWDVRFVGIFGCRHCGHKPERLH